MHRYIQKKAEKGYNNISLAFVSFFFFAFLGNTKVHTYILFLMPVNIKVQHFIATTLHLYVFTNTTKSIINIWLYLYIFSVLLF